MEKFLKDFNVDIKSATKGGKKRMRKVFATMKKGQDKFLKRPKLKKGSTSAIEGSSESTNESDDLQSDVQPPSTVYLSIDTEEEEDGLSVNSSELSLTDQNDGLGQQITSIADSAVDPPPSSPETNEKTGFMEITVEDKNIGNINVEDLEANTKKSAHATQKFSAEQIFVISNFILEVPVVVFDQLSSAHKVKYALLTMLMSMATMVICISELVYKGRRDRVAWQWKKGTKMRPWLYHPAPSNKPFGSITDIIGVTCSISQCVFTAAAYGCYLQHTDNSIKISV